MPPLSHSLVAAGLLSLGAGAVAQPPGPPMGGPGGYAMTQPTNRAEFKTMLETHFDAMDTNHDGILTPDERKAGHEQMRAQMRERMFDRIDSNHDGMISKDEFNAFHRGGPGMDGGPGMGGMHGGPDGPMEGRRHDMMFGAGMKAGPVNKADFVAKRLALFDKVDTNHDGTISPAERDAARQKMRSMRGRAHMPSPQPPGQ